MRVNPNMVPVVLAALSRTQRDEETAIRELSTGKRVNKPSDDPAAAAGYVENLDRSGTVDQYTNNVATLQDMLEMADSALSSVVASVTSAISLGVQGAGGTLSQANMQQIAEQVKGITTQIVSDANTVHKGIYLFGGTDNTTPPFVADATATSGYSYTGNQGTNTVRVGEGLDVTINVPGDQLFLPTSGPNLLASLHNLTTALQAGNQAGISSATADLRSAMDLVSQKRVFYGTILNQLKAQSTYLGNEKLNLESQETTLVGADTARAALQLTQAQTANSAALAAAARVLPKTLLDYLG